MARLTEHTGIEAAIAFVTENFGEPINLTDLAVVAEMPENTLTRHFNRAFGMSPIRWLWRFRTVLAAELIAASPRASLTDVAMFCGFTSSAHFSRRFREIFADSPSQFRRHFLSANLTEKTQSAIFADQYYAHISKAVNKLCSPLIT